MLVLSNVVFHGHVPNLCENTSWMITRKMIILFAWCFNNTSITCGRRWWQRGLEKDGGMARKKERRGGDLLAYIKEEKKVLVNPSINLVFTLSSIFFFFCIKHTRIYTDIFTDAQTHRVTQAMALPRKKIELCVASNYLSGVNNGPNNIFTLPLPINF